MKDDGGPAFPIVVPNQTTGHERLYIGMSLRDWFAGQALALLDMESFSIISRRVQDGFLMRPDFNYQSVATAAYALADAMLEARKKEEGQ